MEIRQFTKEDIEHVFSNLHERCKYEIERFGEDAEGLYGRRIGEPFAVAFTDGTTPQAICYLESIGPMRWRTHFAAAGGCFEAIGLPLSRFFRRFSDDLVSRSGGTIEILSAYGDDTMREWMEALGFSLESSSGFVKYIKRGN